MANISFPNMFDIASGKTSLVYGDTADRQSLKCMLLSNVRELFGDPSFGSTIKELIFEPRNSFFKVRLNQRLQAVSDKLTNINIHTDQTTVSYGKNNNIKIVITYSNNVTNTMDTIEISMGSNDVLVVN